MCVAGEKVKMFFFPAKKLRNAPWEVVRGASPLGQFLLVGPLFLCVEKVRGRK